MTHPAHPTQMSPLGHQRGAGLIDVLISLTIGLVILGAVGVSYIGSSNLMRQYEDQNEVNEPARFALDIMRRHIEMAGYVDIVGTPLATGDPVGNLLNPGIESRRLFERSARDDGTFATPVGIMSNNTAQPLAGCDGNFTSAGACTAGSTTRHSLRVAFQMAPGPGAAVSGRINPSLTTADNNTGAGFDCTGAAVGANPWDDRIATTEFYLNMFDPETGPDVSQLSCRRGTGVAGLVLGVEELVFRYQVAPPGAIGVAAGGTAGPLLTAAQVRSTTTNPAGWSGVTAVEICLVMATTATRGAAALGTVDLQPSRPTCNPADADGLVARADDDVRLWKRFTTVANLRNAVYATPH